MLFNKILRSGTFPSQWTTDLVVPIYKKGDANETNNYRGITLISCFAKLFTPVINSRLKAWQYEYESSTGAQFGFKSNHSTTDAIFILKHLIDWQLSSKKKLYCAFIDLKNIRFCIADGIVVQVNKKWYRWKTFKYNTFTL